MTRWGLIGCGKQGKRYLEPSNNGGRMIVPMHRDDRVIKGLDACIIATPPASHTELAIGCLQRGIAVLLEKPVALTWNETQLVLDAADRPGAPPLLVASPHLYSRRFLELKGGADSSVIWCGPERTDNSCPGFLDWGPHAFSMAEALGTERVVTGAHEQRLCLVASGGKEFRGEWEANESPMLAMIETLERLMHGGFDWRSGKRFTRAVYSKLFSNMPSQACGNDRSGVSKTST